jgi:hypothetical protein
LRLINIAIFLTLGSLSLHAAPILYTMSFTPSFGIAPSSGSFSYDASSLTPFAAFIVNWDGENFDFTSGANDVSGLLVSGTCNTAANNPTDFFNGINGGCAGAGINFIQRAGAGVRLGTSPTVPNLVQITILGLPQLSEGRSASFTISAVPEPSTFGITIVTLVSGLVLRHRRRPIFPRN